MRVGITTSIATAIAIGVLIATGGGGGCTYPACFPDSSNTGVPAGTSLTAYSGANPVVADDTVIDGKIITSCPLEIEAINVTVRNSQFDCTAATAIYIDDAGMYTETSNGTVAAVTVEDVDIDCGGTFASGPTAVHEAHFVLRRVEIVNCENGASINQNVTIEDSFIHDLDNEGADPHEDGIQLSNGHWTGASYPCCALNVTIYHNTIYGMADGDTAFATSAIITNPSGDENIVIEKNLLAGGGTTVYCNRPGSAISMSLIDNHWSTVFHANVGLVSAGDDCADETLSGNVYHESGLPITLD